MITIRRQMRYYLLLFLCLQTLLIEAKEGREHLKDFFSVLGVKGENSIKQDKLKKCFIKITSESIDKYQNFYAKLKQEQNGRFKDFSLGKYGHRIFFHWGLSVNIKRHRALVRQVNKTAWNESTKDAFYRVVQNEWAARVKKIYDTTRNTFGLYTRVHHQGIGGIIYDTHILGDYIKSSHSSTSDPLLRLDDLIGDILNRVRNVCRGDNAAYGDFKKGLNRAKNQGSSEKEKAIEIMKFLKNNLPELLQSVNKNLLEKIFKKNGITFK